MTAKINSKLPVMHVTGYMPKIGDQITISLPDEKTRGTIEKVISPEAVIAKLTQFTTAKTSHPYRKDDLIACKLRVDALNQRNWQVVPQRELEAAADAAEKKPKKGKA